MNTQALDLPTLDRDSHSTSAPWPGTYDPGPLVEPLSLFFLTGHSRCSCKDLPLASLGNAVDRVNSSGCRGVQEASLK